MKGVTSYSGISKFYFQYLLKQIISIGMLKIEGIVILDFGCGQSELKKLLPDSKVIGFDIVPELSDISDWRLMNFDVLVANEVFYSFSEEALQKLLEELRSKNKNLELVVGISKQGILNNIGKFLLGKVDAHSATKIRPKKELKILEKFCVIQYKINVLNLAMVYSFKFK